MEDRGPLQSSTGSTSPPLEARALTVGYRPVVAASGTADLALPAGRGSRRSSGRTAAARARCWAALARILRPRGGAVLLDGQAISRSTREVARRLALLPQGVRAPGELTVRELVGYGRYPHQSLLRAVRGGS